MGAVRGVKKVELSVPCALRLNVVSGKLPVVRVQQVTFIFQLLEGF